MEHERSIRIAKSSIANAENAIISKEQQLGVRGESSIIRYY